MKTIYKYPVGISHTWQTISAFSGTRFIHIKEDFSGQLSVWAIVETGRVKVDYKVLVIGTGWEIPYNAEYVDSCVTKAGYVWHLFVYGRERSAL